MIKIDLPIGEKQMTKEKILIEALNLFAVSGFEAVSVSDIADKLGITKGALYRHYSSKQDVFDCIIRRMESSDQNLALSVGLPEVPIYQRPEEYVGIPYVKIRDFTLLEYEHWTENKLALSFRRMLTIEQYKNKEMSLLYGQYFTSGPIGYLSDIFLGELGNERKAIVAAEAFYAPMLLNYCLFDSGADNNELKNRLLLHIKNFEKNYGGIK